MPSNSRKRKTSDQSEDEVVTKKGKVAPSTEKQEDADGNPYWEISGKRRLQITEFKGMTMVGIREFYEKDGKSLPGKAGISMPIEQFKALVQVLPQVVNALQEKGFEMTLPVFDSDGAHGKDEDVEKPKKPNFEATSDEDEDG